jgi:hypothetical protein
MSVRLFVGVAIVAALLSPPPAAACTCKKPIPGFWQAAEEGPVVVVGEVTRYVQRPTGGQTVGFEIRVIEVLKGDDSRETVELVNLHPSSCEMVPTSVDIGGRYAIVLRPGAVSEGTFSNCRPSISRIVEHMDGRGVTMKELRLRVGNGGGRAARDNKRP